jgi:hypothetical protein
VDLYFQASSIPPCGMLEAWKLPRRHEMLTGFTEAERVCTISRDILQPAFVLQEQGHRDFLPLRIEELVFLFGRRKLGKIYFPPRLIFVSFLFQNQQSLSEILLHPWIRCVFITDLPVHAWPSRSRDLTHYALFFWCCVKGVICSTLVASCCWCGMLEKLWAEMD